MKTATGILRHEHESILDLLEVADTLTERLRGGGRVDPADLADTAETLRSFADRCHHGKEEGLLFPKLVQMGLSRHGGPIAVMLHEHDSGRSFLQAMTAAARELGRGQRDATNDWIRAEMGFSEMLRLHIHKENNVLFMLAEEILSGQDQERLAAEFEAFEERELGPGGHERLLQRIARLRQKILPG